MKIVEKPLGTSQKTVTIKIEPQKIKLANKRVKKALQKSEQRQTVGHIYAAQFRTK